MIDAEDKDSETWFAQSEIERDQIVVRLLGICFARNTAAHDCIWMVHQKICTGILDYGSIFLKSNIMGKMACVNLWTQQIAWP